VQINLQENALKSWLVGFFVSRMRKQIPERQHATYLLSHQNMEYVREPLGMSPSIAILEVVLVLTRSLGLLNKHVGFVYLVDEELKIRWAGCGFARSEERESLKGCTGELLKRLQTIRSSQ